MDCIRTGSDGQLSFAQSTDFLFTPCCLYGFQNTALIRNVFKIFIQPMMVKLLLSLTRKRNSLTHTSKVSWHMQLIKYQPVR